MPQPTPSIATPPSLLPIEILYEDTDLLVVNKPADLLTVPGRGPDKQDCLINRITDYGRSNDSDNSPTARWAGARIIHRLDMATSGIVILALNHATQAAMGKLFSERKIAKRYIATVAGQVTRTEDINLPLICDWPNRPKQKVDHEQGKHATTQISLVSYNPNNNTSRVLLTPITGRSHQLRVHMLAIGHPILGDYFYAPPDINNQSERLLLHAEYIAFLHPVTQEHINIHCPATF
ncbi:pseudouridine synthase [Eionea flava]